MKGSKWIGVGIGRLATERNSPSERLFLSLRKRMEYARWLLAFGGVVIFVGFVVVGFGISRPIPVLDGFAFLSPFVAWGIVLIGLGVMLGFLGAAVKGPSREWSEIAPNPLAPGPFEPSPMRRCPNCGVHTYLNVCPECGHQMPASPTQ
jgi:hypothetical protein